MSFDKDIKTPGLSTINVDVVATKLSASNIRMLNNGRSFDGDDGIDGTARNIKGTILIDYPSLFSDESNIIGTARDDENNGIIFFMSDPRGNDAIMELFIKTGEVKPIAKEDPGTLDLNFSKEHPINGAFVIGDMLYFNDGENPPRKINVKKAISYYEETEGAYESIDNQVISLIKKPPLEGISPFYFTNEEKSINNLRGKMFQFRAAYQYDDNEISATGPISKVALPVGDMDFDGEVVGDLKVNNGIRLEFDTGHHTVDNILIYVREGNTGLWGLVETINKSDLGLDNNVKSTFRFYNTKVFEGEDQVTINSLYHSVPFKADVLGYIHTNNILLAGNTEGFPNVKTDVSFSPKLQEVDAVVTTVIEREYQVSNKAYDIRTESWQTPQWKVGSRVLGLNNLPALNNVIVIKIAPTFNELYSDPIRMEILVTSDIANSVDSFRDILCNVISSNTSYHAVKGFENHPSYVGPYNIFVYSDSGELIDPSLYFFMTVEEYSTVDGIYKSYPGWKSGAEQELGMVYSDDAGRTSFVQEAGDVYLPLITEPSAPVPVGFKSSERRQSVVYSIDWEINHLPPEWATKWRFVKINNPSISYFRRYICGEVVHGNPEGLEDYEADKSTIDISPLNKHKDQNNGLDYSFPNSSIDAYVFQKGDRVRFITKLKEEWEPLDSALGDALTTYVDLEILGYKVSTESEDGEYTNLLIVQLFSSLDEGITGTDLTPVTLGKNSLIEIYRPKKEQSDSVYTEFGEVYDVIEDNSLGETVKVHDGPIEAQARKGAGFISAKGNLENGDIYVVPTVFSVNLAEAEGDKKVVMVESSSYSNYYDLPVFNIGRPNVVNKKAKRDKSLTIRFSERLFEGTEVNGLSEFYGGDDLFLSSEFGSSVTGVVETGFMLRAFQAKKVTSFNIERTGLQLATGESQDQILADSSKIASTKSPSRELYGCINSESILVVERDVYFVDVNKGTIIRIAANGMFEIDSYGIRSEIKKICSDLITKYDSFRIVTSWNPKTNEVGFGFHGVIDYENIDLGTFYFKEQAKGWSSVWNYETKQVRNPFVWASIGQEYFSFVGKEIWKHEANEKRNFIYDKQLPMKIGLSFNKDNYFDKLFKTMEIVGKGNWECPIVGDITNSKQLFNIEIQKEYSSTDKLQQSAILANQFKNVNGKKIAPFLKDANTNQVNKLYNLRNGKDLKGSIINITLVNTDDSEAYIDTVAVLYQLLKHS